jgi:hypothetical protein
VKSRIFLVATRIPSSVGCRGHRPSGGFELRVPERERPAQIKQARRSHPSSALTDHGNLGIAPAGTASSSRPRKKTRTTNTFFGRATYLECLQYLQCFIYANFYLECLQYLRATYLECLQYLQCFIYANFYLDACNSYVQRI